MINLNNIAFAKYFIIFSKFDIIAIGYIGSLSVITHTLFKNLISNIGYNWFISKFDSFEYCCVYLNYEEVYPSVHL